VPYTPTTPSTTNSRLYARGHISPHMSVSMTSWQQSASMTCQYASSRLCLRFPSQFFVLQSWATFTAQTYGGTASSKKPRYPHSAMYLSCFVASHRLLVLLAPHAYGGNTFSGYGGRPLTSSIRGPWFAHLPTAVYQARHYYSLPSLLPAYLHNSMPSLHSVCSGNQNVIL